MTSSELARVIWNLIFGQYPCLRNKSWSLEIDFLMIPICLELSRTSIVKVWNCSDLNQIGVVGVWSLIFGWCAFVLFLNQRYWNLELGTWAFWMTSILELESDFALLGTAHAVREQLWYYSWYVKLFYRYVNLSMLQALTAYLVDLWRIMTVSLLALQVSHYFFCFWRALSRLCSISAWPIFFWFLRFWWSWRLTNLLKAASSDSHRSLMFFPSVTTCLDDSASSSYCNLKCLEASGSCCANADLRFLT